MKQHYAYIEHNESTGNPTIPTTKSYNDVTRSRGLRIKTPYTDFADVANMNYFSDVRLWFCLEAKPCAFHVELQSAHQAGNSAHKAIIASMPVVKTMFATKVTWQK